MFEGQTNGMCKESERYHITTMEEYVYCIERGVEPMIECSDFDIDINLRVQIQSHLFGHCEFGRGDIPAANDRFFRWVWDHKPHYCEECLRPLHNFAAIYCSHILSRGAHPEMAHDVRNINILCPEHHCTWEHATTRKAMRIYAKNMQTIKTLKDEYSQLNVKQ